jgi:hypothetical protein
MAKHLHVTKAFVVERNPSVLHKDEDQEENARDLVVRFLAVMGETQVDKLHPNLQADYVVYRALFTEDLATEEIRLSVFGKSMPFISNALIRLIVLFASERITGLTAPTPYKGLKSPMRQGGLINSRPDKLLAMLLHPTAANGVEQGIALEFIQSAQYAYSMTFRNNIFSYYQSKWLDELASEPTQDLQGCTRLAKLFEWTYESVVENQNFQERYIMNIKTQGLESLTFHLL